MAMVIDGNHNLSTHKYTMSTVEKKEVSDPSVEIGIVASSKTDEEYVGLTGSSPKEDQIRGNVNRYNWWNMEG